MKRTLRMLRQLFASGFTLIELLVVMAIISILSALLLPALAAAPDKARKIADMNNMNQIGKAIFMYTDDWGERVPCVQTAWPSMYHLYGADIPTENPAPPGPPAKYPLPSSQIDFGRFDPAEDIGLAPAGTYMYGAKEVKNPTLYNVLEPYLRDPKVWVNPNAVIGLDENGEMTRNPADMAQSYVAYGYNHYERAKSREALRIYQGEMWMPGHPQWPGMFGGPGTMPPAPPPQPVPGHHTKILDNLDGRIPAMEPTMRAMTMDFFLRNAVHTLPATDPDTWTWEAGMGGTQSLGTDIYEVPHRTGAGGPGYHILMNTGNVQFLETAMSSGRYTSAW